MIYARYYAETQRWALLANEGDEDITDDDS